MDLVTEGISKELLSQGLLGVAVVALGVVIMKLWAKLDVERKEHKVEIAAKDALINEIQEQRLAEALAGRDGMKTFQVTLDAFLQAVRGGKGQQ